MFTYQFDGLEKFRHGSISGVLLISSEAIKSSNAGVYGITVSGASDTNYLITQVNGVLTVNGILPTVSHSRS